jgi:hypothetical protein
MQRDTKHKVEWDTAVGWGVGPRMERKQHKFKRSKHGVAMGGGGGGGGGGPRGGGGGWGQRPAPPRWRDPGRGPRPRPGRRAPRQRKCVGRIGRNRHCASSQARARCGDLGEVGGLNAVAAAPHVWCTRVTRTRFRSSERAQRLVWHIQWQWLRRGKRGGWRRILLSSLKGMQR